MSRGKRDTFLGLDIGTSSVKALLVDVEQRVVAEASTPLSVSRPHPLWSEQDPSDWVEGVEAAVAAIRRHAPSRIRALVRRRPLGPDAWRDPARRARQTAQARDPVERRPLVRRMRRAQAPRSRSRAAHRQSRHARLHRAEDAVGRHARARGRRGDQARAAAQGLCAPAPLRRGGFGDVGRFGHALARRRPAALGREPARGDRPDREAMPSLVEGSEVSAYLSPEIAARLGPRRPQRFRSPAGAATTPRRRSASARRRRGRASFRSAPRASSFPSPTASSACPSARCMRSATRCRIAGTAWR